MAIKFYTSINTNHNELQNFVINPQPNVNYPSTAANQKAGVIYFDTSTSGTVNRLVIRNKENSQWLSIPYAGSIVNSDISSSASIDVSKLNTGTANTGAVTLSSIGVPTTSVAFNGQSITGVNQLTTTGNVTVGGDLTVNGNTTTINTTDLNVEDKNIVIANVASPTNDTADGAGITIKGPTSSDKTFTWIKNATLANSSFTSSENIDLASGKTYKINNVDVLDATNNKVLGKTLGGSNAGDIVTIDGTQILTNKTIGVNQLSGQVAIANGGTGAATAGQNYAFIGPATGGTGAPSFRALVRADLPASSAYKYTTSFTASSGNVTKTINNSGGSDNHGLGATRNLLVQVAENATGAVIYTDVTVGSDGTVTITFSDAASSYVTYDITIIG